MLDFIKEYVLRKAVELVNIISADENLPRDKLMEYIQQIDLEIIIRRLNRCSILQPVTLNTTKSSRKSSVGLILKKFNRIQSCQRAIRSISIEILSFDVRKRLIPPLPRCDLYANNRLYAHSNLITFICD